MNEIRLAREIFKKHRPAKPSSPVATFMPAPAPAGDNNGYDKELALFQQTLFALLLDEELARAVDREGESALRHTGVGRDERRLLAAIPAERRELAGNKIRNARVQEEQERQWRRREELEQWARTGW